jgi:hypothetical protein
MKELPIEQQEIWENKANQSLARDPEGLCKPFCHALLDAIFTINPEIRKSKP